MSKIISEKDVEHVAKLARVALSDSEKKKTQGELEHILEYIGHLKEIKTEKVKPTAHPHEVANVTRPDTAKPFGDRPALFKNAPDIEETYYKVKKIIE